MGSGIGVGERPWLVGQLHQPGQERTSGGRHLALLVGEKFRVVRPLQPELLPYLGENGRQMVVQRGH
jgi:hypothetical protein